MTDVTITVRVDADLRDAFALIAEARDRSDAELLHDVMRDMVRQHEEAAAHDAWVRRQVQAGLASANADHLVPNEDVEAAFGARRAATRQALPTGSGE